MSLLLRICPCNTPTGTFFFGPVYLLHSMKITSFLQTESMRKLFVTSQCMKWKLADKTLTMRQTASNTSHFIVEYCLSSKVPVRWELQHALLITILCCNKTSKMHFLKHTAVEEETWQSHFQSSRNLPHDLFCGCH